MQEVLENYGWFGKIKQAITGGTQFYANKKDKNEESQSRFEALLLEKEIQHIKARVKHPQTNGKVEKWFDLYEKYRLEFETFADFLKWYNTRSIMKVSIKSIFYKRQRMHSGQGFQREVN